MNWGYLSKYRRELMGAVCIWIMLFHNTADWPTWLELIRRPIARGNVGVDVFLLLSGIGLYYSFSEDKRLGVFYRRRFVRLLVPYVLFSLPFYLWRDTVRPQFNFFSDFFQTSFFLEGSRTTWYITALSIFYLLFPLIYYLQEKDFEWMGIRFNRGTITLILCVFATAICRIYLRIWPLSYDHVEIGITRLPVFILGAGLGKTVKEKKPISDTAVLGSAAWIFTYIYVFTRDNRLKPIWSRFIYLPLGVAVAIAFTYMFARVEHHPSIGRVFRWFGDRSLELYLTHIMIRDIWGWYLGFEIYDPYKALSYVCILALAVLVSALAHPLILKISRALLRPRVKSA